MANPYPTNGGPGFPRAPQGPRGQPATTAAAGPALDALRQLVPGNASPAGGLRPNAQRLTEGHQIPSITPQDAPGTPPPTGGYMGVAPPQEGLPGAGMVALRGLVAPAAPAGSLSAGQLGLPVPMPATPPAEQPFRVAEGFQPIPSPYSQANTAIRGR